MDTLLQSVGKELERAKNEVVYKSWNRRNDTFYKRYYYYVKKITTILLPY